MSAHAVSHDADTLSVQLLKVGEESLGKFLGEVAIHLVSFAVGFLCRVQVESCPGSKVPRVIFTLDIQPTCITALGCDHNRNLADRLTWACVRVDDGDAILAGSVLKVALLCTIVACTSETSEVEEYGHSLGGGLRGKVEVQGHLTSRRLGLVGKL